MKHLSLQYIAGFFDGEGCVSIHLNRSRAARYANQQPRIVMQAAMANNVISILRKIQRQYGGIINKQSQYANPRAKQSYRLCFSEQAACKLLTKLLPFLQIKKKQAQLAIKLGKLKAINKQKPLTMLAIKRRMAIVRACKKLNHRGTDVRNL